MGGLLMSEVRAAVYLATKERLDRKRLTAGKLKCNPPNQQCGNRCIPPSWDCRLKGEGPDPHLRAVQTDPLKGLASIERGTKRLLKGVTKGSFSDLEGGKKAIIRGAVQIAPGDLQQKQRLKAQLEARTRTIGVGLAVVTGGLGAHALLMRSNPHNYRYTVGAKINEATREGVNKILDATPLLGQQRSRNRSAVEQLVGETAYRARTAELRGPGALQEQLGKGGEAPLSGVSFGKSANSLNTALRDVDDRFTRGVDRGFSSTDFLKWNKAHRKAFWSVDEPTITDGRNSNIFARPTAESFLTKQYNLTNDEAATRGTIEAALIGRINEDKLSLTRLASQQGFRVKRTPAGSYVLNTDDVPAFVSQLTRTSFGSSPSAQALRGTVEKQLMDTLRLPSDKVASSIYKDTVKGFDEYYGSVAKTMSNISRVPTISAVENRMGYSNIIQSADQSRANYLAGVMNLQRKVAGDAHAELVNLSYYSTRVAGKSDSTYYVSERLARTAASEIAGRPVGTNEEAYRLLTTQYGFTGASRVKPKATKAKSTAPTPTPKAPDKKSKVTTSLNERIQDILARKGNENLSREAAQNIAESEEKTDGIDKSAHRFHADSTALIRTATYIATRDSLVNATP